MCIDARKKEYENQQLYEQKNNKHIQNGNWNYSAKDKHAGSTVLQIIKRKKQQSGRSKSPIHKKSILPHQSHISRQQSRDHESEEIEFLENPDESKKIEKSWKTTEFDHEGDHDSVEQGIHQVEHKGKVKVKHHHHHHHHNHVKTVVKKQLYPVEKIVHVPVEKFVHVPKPYPVEKVVEKVVRVPIEKIVHVPKPYPVEKVIEKIVYVPKPYPVEKIVEKEKKIEVKVPYAVEKIVHVPSPYPVEKIVKVKVPVHIPKPVPYPVEKKVPYPVEVKVLYEVEKKVPYPVKVENKVPYPVKVYVPQPYPVEKKEEHCKSHHPHFQPQLIGKERSYDSFSTETQIKAEAYALQSENQNLQSHQQLAPQSYTSGSVHDAETAVSQSHQFQLAPMYFVQPKQDIFQSNSGNNEQLPRPQALTYDPSTPFQMPQF